MNHKFSQLHKLLFDSKNLHKTFLVVGLSLTFVLSVFMPFFNEPDGQYHLAISGRVSNTIIDTSRYGEYRIDSGMRRLSPYYKDGTLFQHFYERKATFITPEELPRESNYSYTNFVYWGHVVPGIGLALGRMIYPSMGVMITTARLFSSFLSILALAFIIKYLKKGKLVFFAVFLSPVALNSFASLSYDATGFVVVASFVAILINILVDRSLTRKRQLWLAFNSVMLLIASKQNYWLILLLLPFVLLQVETSFFQKWKKRTKNAWEILKQKRSLQLLLLLLVGVAVYLLTRNHGGPLLVLRRYIMTFGYNYSGTGTLSNDITSWLAAPYPSQNFIPTWVAAAWYMIFFAVLFTEEKFVREKWVGFLFLAFFIIGVIGVFYIQLDYAGARTSYIEGVQGRYFTATLILIQPFVSSIKARLNQAGRRLVPLALLSLILVSNALLLFDTVISLFMR
ncbi:DUF2142 domain-containing protein [Streptococcus sp. DD13]|uniref:DUF2142 domain-containing protein n=1 Tax=Streptococcus sp. DD13 TaxID=1777881 RepID=UPI0007972909|nr:DUF2142 domain-containing protein [Streptococcus sp. DD13]KXT79150.1 putative membrane protein [Streptococcus sp. DD13]